MTPQSSFSAKMLKFAFFNFFQFSQRQKIARDLNRKRIPQIFQFPPPPKIIEKNVFFRFFALASKRAIVAQIWWAKMCSASNSLQDPFRQISKSAFFSLIYIKNCVFLTFLVFFWKISIFAIFSRKNYSIEFRSFFYMLFVLLWTVARYFFQL